MKIRPRLVPIAVTVALFATVTLLAAGRFGAEPSLGADQELVRPSAVDSPLDHILVLETGADLTPLAVDTLAITLQVDRSRLPLTDVAEQFRARVAASPDDHTSQTILASTLLALARQSGDADIYAEAETVIDEAILIAPRSVEAQLIKARSESARHDFVSARDRAEAVLETAPGDLAALAVRADAAFELGDVATARIDFEALHRIAPSAATASRLARLAAFTGDVEGSIDWSVDALQRAQALPLRAADAAFYWFQLGSVLLEAGQVEGAAAALEAAIGVDPGHSGTTETLARVRTAQGRLDEAADLYRSLLATGPAADVHGELATVLRLTGNDADARAEIEAGLALAAETIEEYPAERRHLAGFLTRYDPAAALDLARQDVDTRQDIYAYDTLAWALWANDRFQEADAAMTIALSLGTVDAGLYFHAGSIAAAVGDEDRARSFLAASLEINESFDPLDAPRALDLLEQLGS